MHGRLPLRSKSGCLQCRTRKKKCPEQKPNCNKCIHLGLKCSYTKDQTNQLHKYHPVHSGTLELNSSSNSGPVVNDHSSKIGRDFVDPAPDQTPRSTGLMQEQPSSLMLRATNRSKNPKAKLINQPRRSQIVQHYTPMKLQSFNNIKSFPSPSRQIPSEHTSIYASIDEQYAHEYFLRWIHRYTIPRSESHHFIWASIISQVSHRASPAFDAIIACGSIGCSLQRRDDEEKYRAVCLLSLRYANSAIRGTVKTAFQSPLPLTLMAWLFWQLEMLRGYPSNALRHIRSAYQITSTVSDPSLEYKSVVQLVADCNLPQAFCQHFELSYGAIMSPAASVRWRVTEGLDILRQSFKALEMSISGLSSITTSHDTCQQNFVTRITSMLNRSSDEMKWIISKWEAHPILQEQGHDQQFLPSHQDDQNEVQDHGLRQSSHRNLHMFIYSTTAQATIFSPYLENIWTGQFSLNRLEIEFSRVIPVFLVRVAQDDLTLRQDLAELLDRFS